MAWNGPAVRMLHENDSTNLSASTQITSWAKKKWWASQMGTVWNVPKIWRKLCKKENMCNVMLNQSCQRIRRQPVTVMMSHLWEVMRNPKMKKWWNSLPPWIQSDYILWVNCMHSYHYTYMLSWHSIIHHVLVRYLRWKFYVFVYITKYYVYVSYKAFYIYIHPHNL